MVTGVSAARIPPAFRRAVADCAAALDAAADAAVHSVRLYGSVATGRAVPDRSDLDLLVVLDAPTEVDLHAVAEGAVGPGSPVRGVGVSAITLAELTAPSTAGRVERCFVHHYTVVVHGPDLTLEDVPCRGDADLARGFSAGVARRLPAWAAGELPDAAGLPAVGRSLLMAIALDLSTREGGWSTDRRRAVELLGHHAPERAQDAEAVFAWADSRGHRFGTVPDTGALIRLAAWLQAEWAG